jgi:hypothetical protein
MAPITVAIDVERPAPDVFAYAVDPARILDLTPRRGRAAAAHRRHRLRPPGRRPAQDRRVLEIGRYGGVMAGGWANVPVAARS